MSTTMYGVVELIGEDGDDDLIGYGVCAVTKDPDTKRQTFRLLPAVHSTRSTAHTAALDARDGTSVTPEDLLRECLQHPGLVGATLPVGWIDRVRAALADPGDLLIV